MHKFTLKIFLLLILFIISKNIFAQQKPAAAGRFTVSGFVKEASTGESMLGTNVYVKESLQGTTTNAYGFYSITLPKGNYTLVVSFIGYIEQQIPITLDKNVRQNISIEPKPVEIGEVTRIAGETS